MKHAGILAHSAEGASLCFLTFCQAGFEALGSHQHPDVTLDCIAMGHSMPAWDSGDYAAVRPILAESVRRLAGAGAEFFVCPDNTAHIAMELDGGPFALPGLTSPRSSRTRQRPTAATGSASSAPGSRWTARSTVGPSMPAASTTPYPTPTTARWSIG